MNGVFVPPQQVMSRRGVAATADQLATQAAMQLLVGGGTAVDAAIAANAVLAVTAPHLCGMGGDLFALVRSPDGVVHALNASGRAGSLSDAESLRAEGHVTMPLTGDARSVTLPGCVDGWQALHDRFGTRDLATVLAPAIAAAAGGFAVSPLLVGAVSRLPDWARPAFTDLAEQASVAGAPVRRPGVALTLQAIARGGREAFYDGAFGEGLVALPGSAITDADVAASQATWVDPLHTSAFRTDVWTMPPNSQGYLALAIAALAEREGLPADPASPQWAHLLIEAAKTASYDRPSVLHDMADGAGLLAAVVARAVSGDAATAVGPPIATGDTTYLCTADADGWACSLIQSNAAGFGSLLVEPTTGINLHNRGLGFSLERGHPAELTPGRRPPHTLSPALATRDGELAAVLGTMGGDAQPLVVAQVAARLLAAGEPVSAAIAAPRVVLRGPATGFDTWTSGEAPTVVVEDGAPVAWTSELRRRGHHVVPGPAFDSAFGHAHAIVCTRDGTLHAAADPRALIGSAAGT